MTPLNLKKEVEFKKDGVYSICLRGARRYGTSDDFDLSIYTPTHWEHPIEIANIVSVQHLVFNDLLECDFIDNYDKSITSKDELEIVMLNIYDFFNCREIVTILRFKIV